MHASDFQYLEFRNDTKQQKYDEQGRIKECRFVLSMVADFDDQGDMLVTNDLSTIFQPWLGCNERS